MARSLIVLPDDSAKPILAAIEGASRTLRVKMFVFSDPSLLKAVVAAKRRGVKVRVMLNPARRSGEQDNEATRTALERADVDVRDANPAFALTHEKSMVVDEEAAFIKSLNWTTRNLSETRDYAVVTKRRHEVAEIVECFEADWHRHGFDPRDKSHLVWCPGPGRERICRFIDESKHRLFVQNERFQDMVVIEHLVRAARRGVKVDVMARPPHTLKRDKLVDGVAAIVGSINFAAGSLDGRRELAIETRNDEVVDRLHKVARHDWEHSHPLDLSDEGLLADLEDRIENSAQLLAIDAKGEHSGN
jgi:cardiolipin synthase A/B